MPRTVLRITGSDRTEFLQNLITNDVKRTDNGLVYAAILTPQGKYLADFLLTAEADGILLDVASDLAPGLAQRLNMYRLRADVQIAATEITPARGLGTAPAGAFADPRHPDLGWRAYDGRPSQEDVDWDEVRVANVIPQSGIELGPDSYILEAGFERLNGVDFRKGCYVGQEVTARMKHKTKLRKGWCRWISPAPPLWAARSPATASPLAPCSHNPAAKPSPICDLTAQERTCRPLRRKCHGQRGVIRGLTPRLSASAQEMSTKKNKRDAVIRDCRQNAAALAHKPNDLWQYHPTSNRRRDNE